MKNASAIVGLAAIGTFALINFAAAATTVSTNIVTGGVVGVGTASPVSQLDLEGWTVTADGGTLTGGNPQFEINGTLDPTQGATGHVTGAQWYWNTTGSNSLNVNGLRAQLNGGYNGSGLTRVADFQNQVQGTHSLGIADAYGNFGISAQAQGGASDDSTIGDNIGVYAIGNGSKHVNVAVYGRSFDQSVGAYTVANIGVIGVGGHWGYGYPGTSQIGGFFAAGPDGDWYNQLATTSTALLLDNEAQSVPILMGRVHGVNAFTVTSTAGIISTSTTNSTNFWQVKNSSGTTFFDLDSTNQRVGIGTTTPATALQVSSGASATTTVTIGELGLTSSKGCVNINRSDGGAASFYVNAAGTLVVETNYCR